MLSGGHRLVGLVLRLARNGKRFGRCADSDPLIGAKFRLRKKRLLNTFSSSRFCFFCKSQWECLRHIRRGGRGIFGIPLADYLPYVVTRTWHTQLGIFLDCDRVACRRTFYRSIHLRLRAEASKLGVDVLFGALLIVVLGSMAGQWLSVMHMLPGSLWFWFGHQGYEYVDLGRVWQAALFVGLLYGFS
jgi:hypothetical protein